jgi:hypothetical protein
MAAYGSISGDVRQADHWIKRNKKYQDLSAAWLAVLCICERVRLVLG